MWNDFQQNNSKVFGFRMDDIDFSYVTLVCEDDNQIEVHNRHSGNFESILPKFDN